MKALSDFDVVVKGIIAKLFSNVMLIAGISPSGDPAPVNVDSGGNLVLSGGTQTVTTNILGMSPSGSQVIPAGAKGWTVTFLTGTGSIGGATAVAGFSDSDTNTLAAPITVTTNAGSTAYVRWNT